MLKILEETSRTFYLPIVRLPQGLQEAVASAYLCMRAIDEIEDHPGLDPQQKSKILQSVSFSLQGQHSIDNFKLEDLNDVFQDLKARRVVAKIEWHAGELLPRVNFIVTNFRWKSSNVVKFYNKRGTAEQWIKEGKYALNWTRLSCHDFVDNQIRLQLFALAYNLGNFLRRLALPKSVKQWSLRTLRDKLVKIGAKVVSHSRYVIFEMAEVAVPRALFREILNRIRQLRFLTIPRGLG